MIWTVDRRGPGRFAVLDPKGELDNVFARKGDAQARATWLNGGEAEALRKAAAALSDALNAFPPQPAAGAGAAAYADYVSARGLRRAGLQDAVAKLGGDLRDEGPAPARLRLLGLAVTATAGVEQCVRDWIAKAARHAAEAA